MEAFKLPCLLVRPLGWSFFAHMAILGQPFENTGKHVRLHLYSNVTPGAPTFWKFEVHSNAIQLDGAKAIGQLGAWFLLLLLVSILLQSFGIILLGGSCGNHILQFLELLTIGQAGVLGQFAFSTTNQLDNGVAGPSQFQVMAIPMAGNQISWRPVCLAIHLTYGESLVHNNCHG